MEVMSGVKNILRIMSGNGPMGYMPILLISVLTALLTVTTGLAVIEFWEEKSTRFLAIKDLNVIITVYLFSAEYAFYSDKIQVLIDIIDEDLPKAALYDVGGHSRNDDTGRSEMEEEVKERQRLTRTYQDERQRIHANLSFALKIIVGNLSAAPLLLGLVRRATWPQRPWDIHLPLELSLPAAWSTFHVYVLFYILHVVFYVSGLLNTYCLFTSVNLAAHRVCYELKMLCLAVTSAASAAKPDPVFLANVVAHHQKICRTVELINQNCNFSVTISNQCIGIQICLYLYMTVEGDSIGLQIVSLANFCFVVFIIFLYCDGGQSIINENVLLRDSLAQCPWPGKPFWLRRTILFMLTRATPELKVKPFGLYILNLSTFKSVLNASYTFFNVMRTISRQ
ncbi:hypothetical protein LSTR_LSTR006887 [Laodelphax striatellus]|uniref:Odorant receptor n=1 Tax=Laodelphax striatellus TaxID=195883 RepID=A0A482XF28_LAOST|nr:hypothetical protein LSTR_LSTR006887 [Laodelphax striatellus]